MKRAVFPGTFNPFTRGHQSVLDRALCLFDEVVVAIGVNAGKHTESTPEERVNAIERLYAGNPCVKVVTYDDLTFDLCQRLGIRFIVRGIRTLMDFEYEKNLADCNRKLAGIETVLLFTEPELSMVSASNVRELRHFGHDVSSFMPVENNDNHA